MCDHVVSVHLKQYQSLLRLGSKVGGSLEQQGQISVAAHFHQGRLTPQTHHEAHSRVLHATLKGACCSSMSQTGSSFMR